MLLNFGTDYAWEVTNCGSLDFITLE